MKSKPIIFTVSSNSEIFSVWNYFFSPLFYDIGLKSFPTKRFKCSIRGVINKFVDKCYKLKKKKKKNIYIYIYILILGYVVTCIQNCMSF